MRGSRDNAAVIDLFVCEKPVICWISKVVIEKIMSLVKLFYNIKPRINRRSYKREYKTDAALFLNSIQLKRRFSRAVTQTDGIRTLARKILRTDPSPIRISLHTLSTATVLLNDLPSEIPSTDNCTSAELLFKNSPTHFPSTTASTHSYQEHVIRGKLAAARLVSARGKKKQPGEHVYNALLLQRHVFPTSAQSLSFARR